LRLTVENRRSDPVEAGRGFATAFRTARYLEDAEISLNLSTLDHP
jgi:hypothetical protein